MSDVPVQLGHYRLGKTLGIGSFGKVKRTWGGVLFVEGEAWR